MVELDETTLQHLAIGAALCDSIAESGQLPPDWGDVIESPPGEFDLNDLHYVGMLLLTLWR